MGERLRTLRKLHDLTQGQLAELAGVSKSLISKVEAGQRPGTWDLAIAVARALRVDAVSLLGRPADAIGDEGRIAAALPSLRRAMAMYDFPPENSHDPRPIAALAEAVENAAARRAAAQYVRLGEVLPDLIVELSQAAHSATGPDRERAFWLLAVAFRCADALAFKVGEMDLSSTAIERIRWAAEQSGDPLMVGTAAYVRGQTYLVTGAFESGLRALTAASATIERQTASDPKAAAVYGALHMRAAVLAARGHKADEAWSHIEIAKAMTAVVTHDVEWYYTSFGPSNVHIHEVAVAVELGDEREALARAGDWIPPGSIPAERASHHLIDLARAQLWAADYPGALESLLRARRIAPQHTRTHPMAVETARALVRREQRRPDTAIGLATWLGIKT
jgi:transcriptional regulator with XRE-family HTH domain